MASSAQTDQAVIRYLLGATDAQEQLQKHGHIPHALLSVSPSPPSHNLMFSYCAGLHIDGGEFWAVFLKVFQCSIFQLG